MTKERRRDNLEWPDWLNQAWNTEGEGSVYCVDGQEQLYIGTLEGVYTVTWDDWIIKGVKDEIYACKPDVFELTYERVAVED